MINNSNTFTKDNITIMNRFLCLFFAFPIFVHAQSEVEIPIADQFDVVAVDWLDKTEFLNTYAGINEYCQNPTFRKSVNQLLVTIHSYDSLIMSKLNDPSAYLGWNMKEEKKTRSDIESFENDYQLDDFIDEMREACLFRNEIEANAENLRNGVGIESYDAKVMLLETEISRYLHKIDKLVLRIDDHLHVLNIN